MVLSKTDNPIIQNKNVILKPLSRISPSRYTAIKRCPYRIVLANSCTHPLLSYPPVGHLGNVMHECIRLIVTRGINNDNEFRHNWNHLVEKEEQILKDRGFDFFTPLSENVPGYTIKKLQVKSLIREQTGNNLSKENRRTDVEILTEKWLQSKDSLIGGFADIIITKNGYTKLSDFKTGKILLAEGEIKEEYEEQLKLYAYLYFEEFGKYPEELSIIDLERKEYSIEFSSDECESSAEKSRRLLAQTNKYIKKNEYEKLAKPDFENCKNCLYKPACGFYWTLPLSEKSSIFTDVKGKVLSIKQFRNCNLNATLNNDGGELLISHIGKEYLPFLSRTIGKEIAFYNIKQSEIPNRYHALKTTKVYEAE